MCGGGGKTICLSALPDSVLLSSTCACWLSLISRHRAHHKFDNLRGRACWLDYDELNDEDDTHELGVGIEADVHLRDRHGQKLIIQWKYDGERSSTTHWQNFGRSRQRADKTASNLILNDMYCFWRKFQMAKLSHKRIVMTICIWEFAPKRYPEISSHILRYPKISLNSNKSKDKFEGYERISLTG